MKPSATAFLRPEPTGQDSQPSIRPGPHDLLAVPLVDRVLAHAQGYGAQREHRIVMVVAQWVDEATQRNPGPADACLEGIAHVLTQAERLGLDAIPALGELLRQTGGERLPAATFRMLLLDICDRVGRLPAKALLSLCRGVARGVSVRGEGQLLPLPLRDAALHVFSQLDLPSTRRTAMAEALLLAPR